MSFTIAQLLPQNPTGATGGQIIAAYKASRFASPTVAPATNTAAPGNGPGGAGDTSPDGGPVTTGANDIGGLITVATFEPYMVSYYDPADTSNAGIYNLYWLGPVDPVLPTASDAFPASVDQTANRLIVGAKVAAASNFNVLPQSTIDIVSTASLPSSGAVFINVGVSATVLTVVQYTGKTATTLTGCTGGSGTLLTNHSVGVAYQNGVLRRRLDLTFQATCGNTGGTAQVQVASTVGGVFRIVTSPGFSQTNALAWTEYPFASVPVDPLGWYGFVPILTGSGAVGAQNLIETDG